MKLTDLTTASFVFSYYGWARFMGTGLFGVEKTGME